MVAFKPVLEVVYNGRTITADLMPYLVSATYTGEVDQKADTIEIVVEDTKGLWRNAWYPNKGDIITLSIGSESLLVSCGSFSVDEVNFTFPPDQITIRGIATSFSRSVRTKTSQAHEKKTLAQVVNTVAAKNGLTVIGNIPAIFIKRVTQYRETDLNFLYRLSAKYGCTFSIRDNAIIFTNSDALEATDSGLSLDLTEVSTGSLTDKTSESYKAARVSHVDVKSQKVITAMVDATGAPIIPVVPPEAWQDPVEVAKYLPPDIQEIRNVKVENEGQAAAAAAAAMRKNLQKLSGNIRCAGNPLFMEGVTFALTGFGALSGMFHVKRVTHTITRGGHIMDLDIKRLSAIDKSRWQPKTVVNSDFSTTSI